MPRVLSVDGRGKSGLERHGIVRVTGEGDEQVAGLTKVGLLVRDAYEPTVDDVTRSWRDRYGSDVVDALEASLVSVDDQLPDDLPDHIVVRYTVGEGFADVSRAASF